MDIKRIKFERTGGFAGIRFAADIEPDDLPDEQARTLLNCLMTWTSMNYPNSSRRAGRRSVHLFHYSGNEKVATHCCHRRFICA